MISGKAGYHPEGRLRLGRGGPHAAIRAGLPAVAIQQDPLPIQAGKGAQAEITVLEQISHAQAAAIHPLHQRAGGGHLIDGVMVEIKRLRQSTADHMVRRFAGAAAALLQRHPQAGAQLHGQLMGAIGATGHRRGLRLSE